MVALETKEANMTNPDILIPDPLSSNEQYQRFYCLDIPTLEDTKLIDELNYLRPKLWELPEVHWARERVFLLKDELIHRENTKHTPREQPKTRIPAGVKT